MYIFKRMIGILVLFALPFLSIGQVDFGDMENLSDSESTPSEEQDFIKDGDHYYLVWNEWGDLVFRKSNDAGVTWSEKQMIFSALDYGASYPDIAASGDNIYVFYYRNTAGEQQIFFVKSDDGGESFGNEQQISSIDNGAQVPEAVAVDDKVFVAYEARDSNYDYQIAFEKSTDAGDSWTETAFLTDTEMPSRWCNITYDEGNTFISYNEQTGEEYDQLDIFFTKSDNDGESWTTPVNVSENQDYNARLSTFVLDSSVYITSSSKVDGIQSDIRLYRSSDLGDSWEEPILITDNSGDNSRPDIWAAINEANDHRIYIFYSDGTYTDYENAYLKYSVDNGNNWSEHIQVSQDTEDGAWPQIVGQQGEGQDELYFVWNRPWEGSLNFEVWGRPATNPYSLVATINGTVVNNDDEPVSGALVTVGTYTTTTGLDGSFSLEVPAGTYAMTVEAEDYETYYEEIEVENGNTYNYDIVLSPYQPVLFPPLNPGFSMLGSDLTLSWDPPASEGDEMRYDDGNNDDGVGGELEHFEAAIRFPVEDLSAYEGKYLTELNFYITDTMFQAFARVWTGGSQNYAGDLVFEQEVEDLQNGWNHVPIEQPIYIEGDEELWMGYRILNPEGEEIYPAGVDDGPADPYKGDMVLYYSDWVSMYENFGWDFNWNIYGLAVSTETPVQKQKPLVMSGRESAGGRIADFDSYNVYKNDEFLASVPSNQTSYTDEGLNTGTFTYEVTSALDDQESNPSEPLEVVITSADKPERSEVTIQPNPAHDVLKISFENLSAGKPAEWKLTDMQGRQVLMNNESVMTKEKRSMNIKLPAKLRGVYLLHLEWEENRVVKKVMIR